MSLLRLSVVFVFDKKSESLGRFKYRASAMKIHHVKMLSIDMKCRINSEFNIVRNLCNVMLSLIYQT